MIRSLRPAACAALLAGLSAFAAAHAQPPTLPPADKDKGKEAAKPTPNEEKAREAFGKGQFDDALKALQAAAQANPNLAPPKVILSRWFLESNGGQQARVVLEQAIAEDPDHPDGYLLNASYALREGRVTDAIASCEAALGKAASARWDPDQRRRFQREARLGLMAAQEARGYWPAVEQNALALIEMDSKNPQYRQRLARARFQVGKVEEAFADFQAAKKEDDTLDPAELTVAQLWAQRPDVKDGKDPQPSAKAEEWFAKAVKAHEKSAKVHRGYAGWLLDKGRLEAAKTHVAVANTLEPNNRDTKALNGLVARYEKNYPAAKATFEELVREYPTFGFAVANLALCLAESGDTNDKRRAVETAESYLRQNERSADAHAVYGYCLFKNQRSADAEQVLAKAVSGGQASPDTAYYLARLLNEKGKLEEAQKLLKGALDSQGAFVYRKDAEALLADLDKKVPPKKDEPKKP